MLEVSREVSAIAGAERTGIRISPVTPANDVSDFNPQPLFDHIVDQLNALKLTYIHVIEGATGGPRDIAPFDYASLRKRFKQTYMANNGYDFALANKMLESGRGRPDRVRQAVHLQSRSGGAPEIRRAAQRMGQEHLLWRRRQGLHGLPGARQIARGGGVILHAVIPG